MMKINVEMIKKMMACFIITLVTLFASKYRFIASIQIANEGTLWSYEESIIGILFALLYICVVAFCIVNFTELFKLFKTSCSKKSFLYGFLASFWVTIFLYNPLIYTEYSVTKFTGEIGQAIINDVDPAKRVNSFYFMLILFGVNFFVFVMVLNGFIHKYQENILNLIKCYKMFLFIILLGQICDFENLVFSNMRWGHFNYSFTIVSLTCIQAIVYMYVNTKEELSIKKFAIINMITHLICQIIYGFIDNKCENSRELFSIQVIGFFCVCFVLNVLNKKGYINTLIKKICGNETCVNVIYILVGLCIVLSNLDISFSIKTFVNNMDKPVIYNIWEGIIIDFLFIHKPSVLVYIAVIVHFLLAYSLFNNIMKKEIAWMLVVFMPYCGAASILIFYILLVVSVIKIIIRKDIDIIKKKLHQIRYNDKIKDLYFKVIGCRNSYILLLITLLFIIDNFSGLLIDLRLSYMCLIIIFIIGILYDILEFESKISLDDYSKISIVTAMISFGFSIINKSNMSMDYKLLISFLLLMCINVTIIKRGVISIRCNDYNLSVCVIIISFLPILTSLYIEVVNILNQYRVFVANPRLWYILIFCLITSIALFCGYRFKKSTRKCNHWKKWVYLWIIVGVSMLSVQIPLQQTYSPWIYESANFSVLISDFLNYGKIPLVEHYGGHMLEFVLEGVLYGIVNQDYFGAIVSPYKGCKSIIVAVLLFILIRSIWNDEGALLISLFYPWHWMWVYYGMAMISCLAMVSYIKRPTYKNAYLVWGTIIVNILLKLDTGVACAVGCTITYLIFISKSEKKVRKRMIKQFTVSIVSYIIIGVTLWFVLCLYRGVHPIKRLLDFIYISASNNHWALSTLGTTDAELWYIAIPLCVTGCIVYLTMVSNQNNTDTWLYVMMFGWMFISNFSRGLVRHTIYEGRGALYIIMFSSVVALAIFVVHISRKKIWLIVTVTIVLIVVNSSRRFIGDSIVLAEKSIVSLSPIIDSWTDETYTYSDGEMNKKVTYWKKIELEETKVERVQFSDDGEVEKGRIEAYKEILGILLSDKETYVDFCNESFIYSAIERENPVYVSQSPIQISNTYNQKQYIGQIKEVPVVIMSAKRYIRFNQNMDSIEHNYRYYLISDYIFSNYVPLCTVEDYFTVWCHPNRYEKMYSSLKTSEISSEIMYKINMENIQSHRYELSYLPYIWANLEESNNREYIKTLEKKDEYYIIDKTLANEYESVYLTVNIMEEIGMDLNGHNVRVALGVLNDNGEFDEKYYYLFNIKEDISKYLLNISCDAYWHYEDINGIRVECDDKVLDISIDLMGENIEYE